MVGFYVGLAYLPPKKCSQCDGSGIVADEAGEKAENSNEVGWLTERSHMEPNTLYLHGEESIGDPLLQEWSFGTNSWRPSSRPPYGSVVCRLDPQYLGKATLVIGGRSAGLHDNPDFETIRVNGNISDNDSLIKLNIWTGKNINLAKYVRQWFPYCLVWEWSKKLHTGRIFSYDEIFFVRHKPNLGKITPTNKVMEGY